MATFEQRGANVRAQVRLMGQRAYATFSDLEEAQKWAAQTEKRIRNGETIRPFDDSDNPTVSYLLERYGREVAPSKAGLDWQLQRIRRFNRSFPCLQKRVSDFSPDDVREIRNALASKKTARGEPVSNWTVIRELGFLSAVFSHAINEWNAPFPGNMNPAKGIIRPKAPEHRYRRIDAKETAALLAHLGYAEGTAPQTRAQWVAWAFLFAQATAMRKGEILAASWANVHTDRAKRFVHLPTTKNGSARNVPLSSRALELLGWLKAGKGAAPLVPVVYATFDGIFMQAKEALGLEDLHFHDTRHEATTQLAKRLSNVLELKAVTGHKSLKMLAIYFNPTATELADKLG